MLSSFCDHKKTGTLFHRTKADPYVLLSNTLGSHKPDLQTGLCSDLNNSVHTVIRHLVSQSKEMSVLLDINLFIGIVNKLSPELWEHVYAITQSVNERKPKGLQQLKIAYLER